MNLRKGGFFIAKNGFICYNIYAYPQLNCINKHGMGAIPLCLFADRDGVVYLHKQTLRVCNSG